MFLSNQDIKLAIEDGSLIVDPPPENFRGGYDPCSIDVHLDDIKFAAVWDIDKFREKMSSHGHDADLKLGTFIWQKFAGEYQKPVPEPESEEEKKRLLVYRQGQEVSVRPSGFLLWTTKEVIGTPPENPQFICFVNA